MSSERLSADDEAQRTEALFLESALAAQRLVAAKVERGTPGVCTNCGERCLPTTVYCDADCRDDHEARQAARRRTAGAA